MARERGKLARVGGFVEREQDESQARIVAETVQQGLQVSGELRGDGDIRADIGSKPLEQGTVVVAERADVQLHDQPVFDAHPRQLDQHVTAEAPRVVARGVAAKGPGEDGVRLRAAQGLRIRRLDAMVCRDRAHRAEE